MQEYFSLARVAKHYEVSYQSVWRWVMNGRLKARRRVLGKGRAVFSVTSRQMHEMVPRIIRDNHARLEKMGPGLCRHNVKKRYVGWK